MLEFSVLASGSRANCIYIATESTRVLVDCGLSAKQAALRLQSIGVDPESVEAIVVTHEHDDHIAGVRVFAKRFGVKVHATPSAVESCDALQAVAESQRVSFSPCGRFTIGDLQIEPFAVDHDASDPVAFRIEAHGRVLGIVTDLGKVTPLVEASVRGADALVLEANHDWQLLMEGSYPWALKQRISGRKGHLSNEDAGALLQRLNSGEEQRRLRYAIAAHISENNNRPELALEVLQSYWNRGALAGGPSFLAAGPSDPTPLLRL